MKCPHCQNENSEGAHFCPACGMPLHQSRPGTSKAGRAVVGILKALCYILLMVGIQNAIATVYLVFAAAADGSLLTYAADPEKLILRLNELLYGNLTMILLVANLVTILVFSLFFTLRRKNPFEETMLRPVPVVTLPLCALYGVALHVFISVTMSVLPIPQALFDALDNQYAELIGQTNVFVEIFNTAVLTGLVEEVVFRGLTMSRLKRGMNRFVAVAVSAVIFGLFHGALLAVCYATVLGVVFGLLTERFDSILPAVVCHIFFNLTNFIPLSENSFVVYALYFISIAVLIVFSYVMFRKERAEETPTDSL